MKEKFNEKVIPVILKFINTKAIQSIKNGMVTSMSPLIIGSIFLILSNFPVKAVVDVLESTGIKPVLDQVCGATFSISALIAVIGERDIFVTGGRNLGFTRVSEAWS